MGGRSVFYHPGEDPAEPQIEEEESTFRIFGFGQRLEKTVEDRRYVRHLDALGRVQWAPVSEEFDPDEHVRTAALLGFLGVHRFQEHRPGSGILYILKLGGCFGILPAMDVLSMLGGSYRLRDGSYLDQPRSRGRSALYLIATALIGALLVFGFRAAAVTLGQVSAGGIESEVQDRTAEELLEEYSRISGDALYSGDLSAEGGSVTDSVDNQVAGAQSEDAEEKDPGVLPEGTEEEAAEDGQ